MPAISIVIPVYKVERFLRTCLDSVLNQTFDDWEAICINDCSPDNSGKILGEYAKRDKRFKIITKEKNTGVSAARNDGINAARGKYIHFLDADDFIDLDYYEKMFTSIVNVAADMACSGFISNGKYTSGIKYKHQIVLKTMSQKLRKTNALSDSYVWRYLISREFLLKNKLMFNTKLLAQEDTIFILDAIAAANKIVIVPNVLYHYVFNQTSALNNRDAAHHAKIKENYSIGKKFRRDFAEKHGVLWIWNLRKLKKIPLLGRLV